MFEATLLCIGTDAVYVPGASLAMLGCTVSSTAGAVVVFRVAVLHPARRAGPIRDASHTHPCEYASTAVRNRHSLTRGISRTLRGTICTLVGDNARVGLETAVTVCTAHPSLVRSTTGSAQTDAYTPPGVGLWAVANPELLTLTHSGVVVAQTTDCETEALFTPSANARNWRASPTTMVTELGDTTTLFTLTAGIGGDGGDTTDQRSSLSPAQLSDANSNTKVENAVPMFLLKSIRIRVLPT